MGKPGYSFSIAGTAWTTARNLSGRAWVFWRQCLIPSLSGSHLQRELSKEGSAFFYGMQPCAFRLQFRVLFRFRSIYVFVTFHSLVLTLCLAVAFGFMRFLFTLPSQNIIKCMCTVPYFSFFISRGQESGVWPVYFALPSSHASRVQEICSWCGISTLSVLVKSILRVWTPYSPFSFCWTTMSDCFELMFIFLLSPPFFMWRSYILSFCNCCDPSLLRFYSTGLLSIGSNYFDLLKAAERWIMAEGTVKVIFEPFLAPICVWARARDKCHDHSDRCSRYSSSLEMDIL